MECRECGRDIDERIGECRWTDCHPSMEHTICYVETVTEASRVCLIISRLLKPEYRVHYEPCIGVFKIVVTKRQ